MGKLSVGWFFATSPELTISVYVPICSLLNSEEIGISPKFSLKKFLKSGKNYMDKDSRMIIYFSSRGDIKSLKKNFNSYNYKWRLLKVFNKNQKYDNKIYILSRNI